VTAGIVHKDLPHLLGGDGKEMRTALPRWSTESHQAEIGFIHQSGTLQSVVGTFLPQLKMGETLQFVVDDRQQGV
jgi:hypothetical protein